jgi:hypothetical protein
MSEANIFFNRSPGGMRLEMGNKNKNTAFYRYQDKTLWLIK